MFKLNHMKKNKLLFVFLFLLVVLSCKKDPSVTQPEFNINNVAGKSWKITAYTVNGIDFYAELGNERLTSGLLVKMVNIN